MIGGTNSLTAKHLSRSRRFTHQPQTSLKLLAEQGLAYNNIFNVRARLGRLVGADILLVVSITKNRITQTGKVSQPAA